MKRLSLTTVIFIWAVLLFLVAVCIGVARAEWVRWEWTAPADSTGWGPGYPEVRAVARYEMHTRDKYGQRQVMEVYNKISTWPPDPADLLVPNAPGTHEIGYVPLFHDAATRAVMLYSVDANGNYSQPSNMWLTAYGVVDTPYVNVADTYSAFGDEPWVKLPTVATLRLGVRWATTDSFVVVADAWPAEVKAQRVCDGTGCVDLPHDPIMHFRTLQLGMKSIICPGFHYVAIGGERCYTCCP